MASPGKSPKPASALRREQTPGARRHDPDQTDPNAQLAELGSPDEESESTVAGPGPFEEEGALPIGAGDKTQVYDPKKTLISEAAAFKLVVLAGPKAGAEYALTFDELTVGRGADNEISIPDVSVSRKHIRMFRNGDEGFVVEDLGSGNGTKVNDARIEKPCSVGHGDEIVVGDTVLQLCDVAAPAAKKRPKTPQAPSGRTAAPTASTRGQLPKVSERTVAGVPAAAIPAGRRRLYLIAGAFVGVLLLLGVAKKMKGDGAAEQEGGAQQADPALLDEARDLARKHKWIAAEAKAKEAVDQGAGEEGETFLAKVHDEAAAQKKLETASRAFEGQDFSNAKVIASQISEKADVYDKARELLRSIDQAMGKALSEAKTALATNDRDRARLLIDRVLAADAQNEAALALKEELEKKTPKKADPGAKKAVVASAKTDEDKPPEPPRPAASASKSAYLAGDLSKALRAAEDAGDANLKSLRMFDAAFRDGVAKAQANRTAEAVKSLGIAAKADREISGGKPSKLGLEVLKALANQEYLLGLDCKGDEQLPRAAAHFQAAVEADPQDLYSKALDRAYTKAKDLYLQGYVARATAPDEAKKLFKVACDTLPATDEKHDKACRFFDQLGGK